MTLVEKEWQVNIDGSQIEMIKDKGRRIHARIKIKITGRERDIKYQVSKCSAQKENVKTRKKK